MTKPLSAAVLVLMAHWQRWFFDASGNKSAIETGHHYMRHGGTYVLVGLYKHGLNFMHPELHRKRNYASL